MRSTSSEVAERRTFSFERALLDFDLVATLRRRKGQGGGNGGQDTPRQVGLAGDGRIPLHFENYEQYLQSWGPLCVREVHASITSDVLKEGASAPNPVNLHLLSRNPSSGPSQHPIILLVDFDCSAFKQLQQCV